MRILLTILTFELFAGQSCSTRDDKIFGASDELHYINLYKTRQDFEIVYNGVNTATGTYTLKNDTILLTYTENQFKDFDPNKALAREILIDTKTKKVRSIDKGNFCADIYLDERDNK
jgi:hypothetical protein